MATNTPNYNLIKPDYENFADIEVLNGNADKIDTALKGLQDTKYVKPSTGIPKTDLASAVQTALDKSTNIAFATQAEAEEGTNTTKYMNPLRTRQAANDAISDRVATQVQAQAGTDNTTIMTPLQVKEVAYKYNNLDGTITDLNFMVSPGKYRLSSTVGFTNVPFSNQISDVYLDVTDRRAGGLQQQVLYAPKLSRIYYRGKTDANVDSWTEWKRLDNPEIATTEQAQAGTDNTTVMTPLKVFQAIDSKTTLPNNSKTNEEQLTTYPQGISIMFLFNQTNNQFPIVYGTITTFRNNNHGYQFASEVNNKRLFYRARITPSTDLPNGGWGAWLRIDNPEIATTAQALSGTDNTTVMTPLRVNEVFSSLGLNIGINVASGTHPDDIKASGIYLLPFPSSLSPIEGLTSGTYILEVSRVAGQIYKQTFYGVNTVGLNNVYTRIFNVSWSPIRKLLNSNDISTIEQAEAGANNTTVMTPLRVKQSILANSSIYGVAIGTNTLTLTLSPAPTALTAGFTVRFKNTTANTGAVTLNVNELGAKQVLRNGNLQLSAGILKANGVYTVTYDGTSFILQGEGGEYGTASAPDVLTGKTIGTESGLVVGTMPNNGSNSLNSDFANNVSIPKGYYDGTGFIQKPLAKPGTTKIWELASTGSTMQNSTMQLRTSAYELKRGGTYRIGFTLRGGDATNILYGQIYVNGVPKGILRQFSGSSTGMQSYTEDLALNEGDIIQFYGRCTVPASSWLGYMESFFISVSIPTFF